MYLVRYLCYLSILSMVSLAILIIYNYPSPAVESIARVAPRNIKEAMWKMGPYYDYKMIGDKLYVSKGDNKWRKLNYKNN